MTVQEAQELIGERAELYRSESQQALVSHPPVTPMEMLNRAVSQGADITVLEKLMTLQERWQAQQARRAFDDAIAAAKAEIPIIAKNREVDFTSPKGRTHYKYEDLAEIARVVTPILGKHGLSYRFRTTSNPGDPITVTCILSHRDGHFEENTLCAARDESGNKNNIQAIGSSLTYLQRMTLKAALGLAAAEDDDGRKSGDPQSINNDQLEELHKALIATNSNIDKFCELYRIEALSDLPAAKFDDAKARLAKKAARSAAQ